MDNKGFTVIEMLVALGIFSILLVAAMGAFGNGYASQRKILEMQAVQREGAYLLEVISREIRMASSADGMSTGNSESWLAFANHDNKEVRYCLAQLIAGNPVCTNSGDYFAMIKDGTGVVMNSSGVKINKLTFYSSDTDDNYSSSEPMVTISMTLQSAKDPEIKMTLQTSVAMRLYYLH